MPTKLELRFATSEGKNRTISVNHPVLDLEPAVVQSSMETIAEQGMFVKEGAGVYDGIKGARYVTRIVDDLFDVEANVSPE